MYISGNIEVRNWFHLFESPSLCIRITPCRRLQIRSYGCLYSSNFPRCTRDFSFKLLFPFQRRMNPWWSWSFGRGSTTGRYGPRW